MTAEEDANFFQPS